MIVKKMLLIIFSRIKDTMGKKVVAVVQARMGSTRLPGKVMLDLDGKPVIERVIERLERCKLLDAIVIATTPSSDEIIDWCCENKIKFIIGSEDDVLGRVAHASRRMKADVIVDITADCPLIDPEVVDQCIGILINEGKVHVTNTVVRTFPDGFDVQVYTLEILEKINEIVTDKNHRKHTGWNIDHYLCLLKELVVNVLVEDQKYNEPEMRVTLDTEEDYLLIQTIFETFRGKNFGYKDVIDLLRERPALRKLNDKIKPKVAGEG